MAGRKQFWSSFSYHYTSDGGWPIVPDKDQIPCIFTIIRIWIKVIKFSIKNLKSKICFILREEG